MSATYTTVQWNRQKRRYDRIMVGIVALYLLVFIVLQFIFYPKVTPETLIIRATGTLAFLMLHVILCIGPLARLDKRFLPLLYNRRHLGVTTFLIGTTHGIFNIVQFHSLGYVDPLVSLFASNTNYQSFQDFPFQVLGFFALIILFLMAATSHDFWLKNLHPKIWKSLHMLVYLAYALLVFHVMLGAVQLEQSPAWIGLTGLGMITVVGLHLTAGKL
ncbi:MAG: ferric reductase-like transmembrane domain-containing protein [Saprospiraceae bacterium]